MKTCFFAGIVVLICTANTFAAITVQWTNYGTGSWFDTGNWTPHVIPASDDTVYLNSGGTVLINQPGAVCHLLRFGITAAGWGKLEMNSGSLTTTHTHMGTMYSTYGIFIQNGGTHTTEDLTLAYNSSSSPCSYTLSQGQLTVTKSLDIGYREQGTFTQTGGQIDVDDFGAGRNWDPDHTGGSGVYSISGGRLNAQKIYIGAGYTNSGTFTIENSAAEIYVSKLLHFCPMAHFHAVANSVIHLAYQGTFAAVLDNSITSSVDIAGLANTRFVFGAVSGQTSTLEIAGRDYGDIPTGFENNFAIDTLALEENASVRLINNYDNQPAWTGREALYVDHLILAAGSTLDCNCYHIYYNTLENLGGTIINGDAECNKLEVSASPTMIASDGVSKSTITATLTLLKSPAAGKLLWISTDIGYLESMNDPDQGTRVMATTNSNGKAFVQLSSTEMGIAHITAEYEESGLTATCTVEVANVQLVMQPDDPEYHEVPAIVFGQVQTTTRPASSDPAVTLYGKTVIPILIQINDDSGLIDVANQLITLSSPQRDTLGRDYIDFPDYIATDPNGMARIEVQINDLWQAGSIPGEIVITASLQNCPDLEDDVILTVINNWQELIDYLPMTLKRGVLWEDYSLLSQMEKKEGHQQAAQLRELFESGLEGSFNNLILSRIAKRWGTEELYTRVEATECGGYQAAILGLFDSLRLNKTNPSNGQYQQTDWLFNGIDYGPIHILGGGHVAAMIYPRLTGQADDWRSDYTRVLDPWLQQDPTNAVYTWNEWSIAGFMALMCAIDPLFTSASISPHINTNSPVNNYYPANGCDYPAEPNLALSIDYATFSTVIIRCPVRITLNDNEGHRSGYDPNKQEDSFIDEIPGVFWGTLRMPDDTAGWFFDVPRDKILTASIQGYDAGTVDIHILPGTGQLYKYTTGIENEQSVTLQFDTNTGASPGLALNDGTFLLPVYTLEFKDWSMRQTPLVSIGTLTVENQQNIPLYGPLTVTIETLTPESVKPLNTNGTKDGQLSFDLTAFMLGQPLAPGQSISIPVVFDNPDQVLFDLTCRLDGFTEQGTPVKAFYAAQQIGKAICGDINHPCSSTDMNMDCTVEVADLIILLDQWLTDDCGNNGDCLGMDLNRNGTVEMADIAEMASAWMTCNDPAGPCFYQPDSTPLLTLPPQDFAELNAYDWLAWADGSSASGTFVSNDTQHFTAGQSAIKFVTDGGFDTFIRYPLTYDADWNLSAVSSLDMTVYSTNTNSFQSSPWIRLKTDNDNYFEYVYYRDGYPYELLNEAFENWLAMSIPLNAGDSEENGWRRTTVGSPDMTHIRQIEFHADTWDFGFQLWLDNVHFDIPANTYTDFNRDGITDCVDLQIIAQMWLRQNCFMAACRGTDMNQDRKVDLTDWAIFASHWAGEN